MLPSEDGSGFDRLASALQECIDPDSCLGAKRSRRCCGCRETLFGVDPRGLDVLAEPLFGDAARSANAKGNGLPLAFLTRYINPEAPVSSGLRIPRLAVLKHTSFLSDTA